MEVIVNKSEQQREKFEKNKVSGICGTVTECLLVSQREQKEYSIKNNNNLRNNG